VNKACVEEKHTLDNRILRFDCTLLYLDARRQRGILHYLVPKNTNVGALCLLKDWRTYAFYWQERPYTLYQWFDAENCLVGSYFNIADHVRLTSSCFRWRDLVLDILIYPDDTVKILDEDELRQAAVSNRLLNFISRSCSTIIKDHAKIIDQAINWLKGVTQSHVVQA